MWITPPPPPAPSLNQGIAARYILQQQVKAGVGRSEAEGAAAPTPSPSARTSSSAGDAGSSSGGGSSGSSSGETGRRPSGQALADAAGGKGTGGTGIMSFLHPVREETTESLLGLGGLKDS